MDRSFVMFVLVALFGIAVFAVAGSSLDTAAVDTGFGIDGGATSSDPGSRLESGKLRTGGSGGTGGSGFFDATLAIDPTDGGSGSSSPVLIGVIVVSITAGGLALVFWATGSPDRSRTESMPAPSDDESESSDSPFVAPSNEVYRAWWELVRQLDVTHHQSLSPAELASIAVDEGRDPELVAELTALFRSVRYGGVSVTNEVERRAAATRDRLRSSEVRPPIAHRLASARKNGRVIDASVPCPTQDIRRDRDRRPQRGVSGP